MFHNKYLKYKKKYLNLKKLLEGGGITDHDWLIGFMINNFHMNSACKIINSFNGDGHENGASKYDHEFRTSSLERQIEITFLLKKNLQMDNYMFNLCSSSPIVIFYNTVKLDLLLASLRENNINISKDNLLNLPCIYSHTRDIKEILLIAILYGNILPCNSVYQGELPYNINDPLFDTPDLINLKKAYISYLNKINPELLINIPSVPHKSIDSIIQKRTSILEEEKTRIDTLFHTIDPIIDIIKNSNNSAIIIQSIEDLILQINNIISSVSLIIIKKHILDTHVNPIITAIKNNPIISAIENNTQLKNLKKALVQIKMRLSI